MISELQRITVNYGKPLEHTDNYGIWVGKCENIDLSTDGYLIFNKRTGVREAEFSNLAQAISGMGALEAALHEARTGGAEPEGPDDGDFTYIGGPKTKQ